MQRRTVHRVCTLCEATCGLAVEVEGRRVLAIRGDVDAPSGASVLNGVPVTVEAARVIP
jgi:predicted molibdopterin-dependent oxidoreductase YjgC